MPHVRRRRRPWLIAERQACAKIAEDEADRYSTNRWSPEAVTMAGAIAKKIRERRNCLVVAFEGADGTGKGLQTSLLSTRVKNSLVVPVPVPGALHYATIRAALKNGKAKRLPNFFQTITAQNKHDWQARCFAEAMSGCDCLILDRWTASAFAYGRASGLDVSMIAELNENLIEPDITFVLTGGRHVIGGDAYERDAEYQALVAKYYLQWTAANPRTAVVVACMRRPDEVATEIWARVKEKLPR